MYHILYKANKVIVLLLKGCNRMIVHDEKTLENVILSL